MVKNSHSAILESRNTSVFFSTSRRHAQSWRECGFRTIGGYKDRLADGSESLRALLIIVTSYLDNTNRGWSLRWRHPQYTCLCYPSYTWRSFAFKVAPAPFHLQNGSPSLFCSTNGLTGLVRSADSTTNHTGAASAAIHSPRMHTLPFYPISSRTGRETIPFALFTLFPNYGEFLTSSFQLR